MPTSLVVDAMVAFVPSTDLERSRAFYADLLGLEWVETTPYACVLRCGGTTLRVALVDELTAPAYTVLGWVVDDLAVVMARLADAGVEPTRYEGMGQDEHGVWRTPTGDLVAWFRDPDGSTLSLTQLAGD